MSKKNHYKKTTHLYNPKEKEESSFGLFDNLIWLKTDEAAKYLRKSKNAIRIMVSRGHLPVKKFKRRLYFKRSDLDALLNASFYY